RVQIFPPERRAREIERHGAARARRRPGDRNRRRRGRAAGRLRSEERRVQRLPPDARCHRSAAWPAGLRANTTGITRSARSAGYVAGASRRRYSDCAILAGPIRRGANVTPAENFACPAIPTRRALLATGGTSTLQMRGLASARFLGLPP